MNHSIELLDGDNTTKLVPASFSDFLELYERKINFSIKRMIDIITVIISLHYRQTN